MIDRWLDRPADEIVVTNHVQIFSIVVLSQTAPARIKSDASSTYGCAIGMRAKEIYPIKPSSFPSATFFPLPYT